MNNQKVTLCTVKREINRAVQAAARRLIWKAARASHPCQFICNLLITLLRTLVQLAHLFIYVYRYISTYVYGYVLYGLRYRF